MDQDWPILMSFFPQDWEELAVSTNAVKGLRKEKTVENYIRTLLIHIGCGYSMRETVARAKLAGLGDISDVAFLGRLRKAKDWLQSLCLSLIKEQGISFNATNDIQPRLFDATFVKEPGKTGSLWRIHYSIQLPSLTCDFLKITPAKGCGTGESFFQYSIKNGDYIIADRGYSTISGIHHVASRSAYVIVRVNTLTLPLHNLKNKRFPLLDRIQTIKNAGTIGSWDVLIKNKKGETVQGRICVIRKTKEAIEIAHKKLKKVAQKRGSTIKPETYEYAKYVILFTTYPKSKFLDYEILELYRSRWQIELVFKRFKSIAHLGHLPKQSEDSSKAWLYGKLFVAILTNKLITYADSISPWGYELGKEQG